jgi:hypothetical protein
MTLDCILLYCFMISLVIGHFQSNTQIFFQCLTYISYIGASLNLSTTKNERTADKSPEEKKQLSIIAIILCLTLLWSAYCSNTRFAIHFAVLLFIFSALYF